MRLHRVAVLLEKGIAEHAGRARGAGQGLDDGVVVLAGIDPGTVLAQGVGQGLEPVLITFGQGRQGRYGFGRGGHGQLQPGVARARGRRRAIDLDARGRQAGIDLIPRRIGVGDEGPVRARHFLGDRQIDVIALEAVVGRIARRGDDQAVVADLDFNDIGNAVGPAERELRGLHPTRGIGDVRGVGADALAEGLNAAAGAQRFDARRGAARGAGEILGHAGGEGEDGR